MHQQQELLSSRSVSIGFHAPSDLDRLRALDAAGAAAFWVGGHVASANPSSEVVVRLAQLVEVTQHAVVGSAILLLPLYPPGLLAKQIADLDRASGGRLVLGVGVGGEQEGDFRACGVPMSERGSRANEAIPLLRQFWQSKPVTHDGLHYHFADVLIHPPPAQFNGPPIVVSGRKPAAMRRAALLGDGWMPYLYSARRYRESVQSIRAIAATAGRDLSSFRWIAYLNVQIDDDRNVARRQAIASLGRSYPQDFTPLIERVAVFGTPDEVQTKLQEFVDAGARHLIVNAEQGEWLLAEVLPRLQPLPSPLSR
jgi:probable F420-dependent oxidoreductase